MNIEINADISVSVNSIVKNMSTEELGEFLSLAAEILNTDFKHRNAAAKAMASGLSEDGCRFLAEVITHHHIRN